MKIAGTEYTLSHKAFEIYLAGCRQHPCEGCHNVELWDFENGEDITKDMMNRICGQISSDMVERVWILGGEPFDQPFHMLYPFLVVLKTLGKEVWVWTHYAYEDIMPDYLEHIDYVKTGAYVKELPSYKEPLFGITLASNNQQILKVAR